MPRAVHAATAAAALAAVLASGCGGGAPAPQFTSQERRAFISGCTESDGSTVAYCRCVAQAAEREGDVPLIRRSGGHTSNPRLAGVLARLQRRCAPELSTG